MSQKNKNRTPPPADFKILSHLQSGRSINNIDAIQIYGNAMLRDAIWRLSKAGYQINREWVHYVNRFGKAKKYKSYFMTNYEILPAGAKTEKEEIAYKKGVKTAAEFATGIIDFSSGTLGVSNPDPEEWIGNPLFSIISTQISHQNKK